MFDRYFKQISAACSEDGLVSGHRESGQGGRDETYTGP